MLHMVYILVFTVIAFLAISNLIRNLVVLSTDSHRHYAPTGLVSGNSNYGEPQVGMSARRVVPHPELLDESGKPINEPLLVMRSLTVEDARQKLDDLYNSSPGKTQATDEEI